MRPMTVGALAASLCLGLGANPAFAQQRETVQVDGWTISVRSDGRGPCRLEQATAADLFRYSTNDSITVVGGTIGEVDTRRPVSLIVAINGRAETVRATASRFDEGYGYTFTPRRPPSFSQGFDLVLVRGEETVFRYEVRGAAAAFEEMLDCGSDPFWPEPW